MKPTKMIAEVGQTDLIIVTTIFGDMTEELRHNEAYIPWLRRMHLEHQTEIASLCVGAFLLAATGLIDGRECSTHWSYAERFTRMFPRVNLVPEQIITDESGLYSSGGSYSFLNLMLYLVEKYNGKEVANWVARMFEIEIDRNSQGPFIIFSGQKNHEDLLIKEIQTHIEENYQHSLSLNDLAVHFNLSKRNLIRRFIKATLNTPNQYLQRVKIESAKRELEKTNHSIGEIMFDSGYSDVSFSRNL